MFSLALSLRDALSDFNLRRGARPAAPRAGGGPWVLRGALARGSVVAGTLGLRQLDCRFLGGAAAAAARLLEDCLAGEIRVEQGLARSSGAAAFAMDPAPAPPAGRPGRPARLLRGRRQAGFGWGLAQEARPLRRRGDGVAGSGSASSFEGSWSASSPSGSLSPSRSPATSRASSPRARRASPPSTSASSSRAASQAASPLAGAGAASASAAARPRRQSYTASPSAAPARSSPPPALSAAGRPPPPPLSGDSKFVGGKGREPPASSPSI